MTEYIKRDDVIEAIASGDSTDGWENIFCGRALIGMITQIPAADVQSVVLCRNCKYCIKEDEFEYWCNGFCSLARLVREDDYCSHGAEREEG